GRIFDKDGGYTTYGPVPVLIANVAPSIAISGAASVNEGAPYTLTLGPVTDPASDTVTQYIVHWGDATTATSTTGGDTTHAYADGRAAGAVTVDLVDEDGTHTDHANPLSGTVNTVAPTATFRRNISLINEGGQVTYSFSNPSDPSSVDTASGFRYSIALL